MTSILELNLQDIPDLEIAPPDEYELILKSVEIKESKSGGKYINLGLDFIGQPNIQRLFHVVMLPDASLDDDVNLKRKRRIKALYEVLDIPLSGEVDLADSIGNTLWAFVGEQEGTAQYPEPSNNIKRFVTPA